MIVISECSTTIGGTPTAGGWECKGPVSSRNPGEASTAGANGVSDEERSEPQDSN
jgi:hypothetical protein